MQPCYTNIMLNLKQIEIFRAVVESGSATAAARQLRVSQPAISRRIAELEKGLGVSLFYRRKGRLIPSPHANALYSEAKKLFAAVDHLETFATGMRTSGGGVLRLALPHSMCHGMLPGTLARFSAQHPNARFSVLTGDYDKIQELVASRQADLGLARLPLEHPGIEVVPLATVRSVCVMPSGHALAKKRFVSPEDLREIPLVLLNRRLASRFRIIHMCESCGFSPLIRIETHSVGSACAFVEAGFGVTIMNELMAAQYANTTLLHRPFRPAMSYRFVLAFPENWIPSTICRNFANHLKDEIDNLLISYR